MENFVLSCMPVCCIHKYIMSYILHPREYTKRLEHTDTTEERKWSSWKTIHTLETAADRPKNRNLDLHAKCMANSCQGKDAGVLFQLNYLSIHWHWV